jgi:DNA (cytosine-5)-methyltransferase 1
MTSATYTLLKGILDACGYFVNEIVLDSDNTKSVENRKRYWFVATSKGLSKVDLTQFPQFQKEYSTVADILDDVPSDSRLWKSTAEKVRKAAVNKALGKNFGFNLINPHEVEHIGVCGRGYQKDRASEPHIQGENNTMRLLTVNELAKAQSTPIHLVDGIIDGVAYEGLGQSIDYRQCLGVFDVISKQVLLPMM